MNYADKTGLWMALVEIERMAERERAVQVRGEGILSGRAARALREIRDEARKAQKLMGKLPEDE